MAETMGVLVTFLVIHQDHPIAGNLRVTDGDHPPRTMEPALETSSCFGAFESQFALHTSHTLCTRHIDMVNYKSLRSEDPAKHQMFIILQILCKSCANQAEVACVSEMIFEQCKPACDSRMS